MQSWRLCLLCLLRLVVMRLRQRLRLRLRLVGMLLLQEAEEEQDDELPSLPTLSHRQTAQCPRLRKTPQRPETRHCSAFQRMKTDAENTVFTVSSLQSTHFKHSGREGKMGRNGKHVVSKGIVPLVRKILASARLF